MRLSELMSMKTFDVQGKPIDHVKDVRLEKKGEHWEVTALIVGRGAFAERLGFLHGVVERPALLARLMGWFERHARVAPWENIRLSDGQVLIDTSEQELPRPGDDE